MQGLGCLVQLLVAHAPKLNTISNWFALEFYDERRRLRHMQVSSGLLESTFEALLDSGTEHPSISVAEIGLLFQWASLQGRTKRGSSHSAMRPIPVI